MPPTPFGLPGPHDVHNAGSVKLAEATRIRLILPGLNLASSKSDATAAATANKSAGKPAGDAAAASAKVQKKLQKLQGIASQAEQAHAGVIVLQEDEEDETSPSIAEAGSKVSSSSKGAAGSSVLDRRKGATGCASTTDTQAGGSGQDAAARNSRTRPRSLAAAVKAGGSSNSLLGCSDGICQGSRLVAASNISVTSPDANTGVSPGSGPGSGSSSASSSRRGSGDKHVPIWERSCANGLAESRRLAAANAAPKVLQPVTMKTFSPTLGSLGAMLAQDAGLDSSSSRPAGVTRSRSAVKAPGGSPGLSGALKKHITPPHGKLAAAAMVGQTPAAALAAAAAPLGVDLPSSLRHVSFTNSVSVYTPSQLLEKLILK